MTTSDRMPIGATMTLRQKLVVLAALLTTMFITVLDGSIVSTAAPRIVADLGGFDLFAWVFTIFLLASTITIPIVGKLSDMFGRKRFLLGGIALFIGASVICGAAQTMPVLIAARGLQGAAAGLIISCVFATLGDVFTPIERARYVAFLGGMFTVAQLVGPALGGVLSDGPGWRWCFYINLPIGALAALLVGTQLPADGGAGGRWRNVDVLGALLLGGATSSFMVAVSWSSTRFGWGGTPTFVLLSVAAILGVAFFLQERRHPEAIMPLALFRNVPWTQAVGIVVIAAGAIGSSTLFLPTFVQTSLGRSAAASGLVIIPQALGGFVSTVISGQVVARTGRYKAIVVIGAAGTLLATFLLRGLSTTTPPLQLSALMVLAGLSTGVLFPISQIVAQASVSQSEQGIAASSRQFFLQLSNVFGVGLIGLLLTTSYVAHFEGSSQQLREALPAATYARLLDPTIALDPARFSSLRDEVAQSPGGDALLASALEAQRESVAGAIDRVYDVSTVAAVLLLALALSFRAIPLHDRFTSAPTSLEVERVA